MNILSQIVPGVREARTPFAIGVLWALTGWLGCSFLPQKVWQAGEVTQLASQAAKIPNEAKLALATFLVYVLRLFPELRVGEIENRLPASEAAGEAGHVASQ